MYEVRDGEAQALFDDLKRWLWLKAQPDAPVLVVTREMQILDEMWHCFILFTEEYASFCEHYCGGFVHHHPTTHVEEAAMRAAYREAPAAFMERRRAGLTAQYEYIFDMLGEETLLRWYVEYPRRYDRAFFARAYKPPRPPELPVEIDPVLRPRE
ncbi:MAG TPA: hypothetical protein VML75_04815 [Kofleriaceae bacterium]|nr:hypothetical protein [Kofleriaceae bacterium]